MLYSSVFTQFNGKAIKACLSGSARTGRWGNPLAEFNFARQSSPFPCLFTFVFAFVTSSVARRRAARRIAVKRRRRRAAAAGTSSFSTLFRFIRMVLLLVAARIRFLLTDAAMRTRPPPPQRRLRALHWRAPGGAFRRFFRGPFAPRRRARTPPVVVIRIDGVWARNFLATAPVLVTWPAPVTRIALVFWRFGRFLPFRTFPVRVLLTDFSALRRAFFVSRRLRNGAVGVGAWRGTRFGTGPGRGRSFRGFLLADLFRMLVISGRRFFGKGRSVCVALISRFKLFGATVTSAVSSRFIVVLLVWDSWLCIISVQQFVVGARQDRSHCPPKQTLKKMPENLCFLRLFGFHEVCTFPKAPLPLQFTPDF